MFLLEENKKLYFIENSKDLLFLRNLAEKEKYLERMFLFDKFLNGLEIDTFNFKLKEIEAEIIQQNNINLKNISLTLNKTSYFCENFKIDNVIIKYNNIFYKCSKFNLKNVLEVINPLELQKITNYNKILCNLNEFNDLKIFTYFMENKSSNLDDIDINNFDFKLLKEII